MIDHGPRLRRWEKRTEWPLAVVAGVFLAVYSVQVLVQPPRRLNEALDAGLAIVYVLFVIDYLVRLMLAFNRVRWFFGHMIDLAIVVLPFLRPLRLLRLLVLLGALQRRRAMRSEAGSSSTPRSVWSYWCMWHPWRSWNRSVADRGQ